MKIILSLATGVLCLVTADINHSATMLEITGTTVLPATLITGSKDNTVVLSWSARNETGDVRYEIERSFYSDKFTPIAALAVPFSGGDVGNYSINDKDDELSGRLIAYYRVKQIAADSAVIYSNVKVVKLKDNGLVKTLSGTTISYSAVHDGNATVRIKNITGQLAKSIKIILTRGTNTVELNNLSDLSKGIYLTEILVNGEVVNTQKIIVE